MTIRTRRSALFMPASNARAVEKARSLDCDVVLLDLEDSVAPDLKASARAQAIAAAAHQRQSGRDHRVVTYFSTGPDTVSSVQ